MGMQKVSECIFLEKAALHLFCAYLVSRKQYSLWECEKLVNVYSLLRYAHRVIVYAKLNPMF